MSGIKSYADITLMGGLAFGRNAQQFPENPKQGMTCFKDGVLYIYADLNGFLTWYPLNRPQSSYVHSQGIPSLQWTISHGLRTTDVIVAVYDESGKAVGAAVETIFNAENPPGQQHQVTARFTEATAGFAVVFGVDSISTPSMQAEAINAQAITVNNVPVTVETDLIGTMDAMADEFQEFANQSGGGQ